MGKTYRKEKRTGKKVRDGTPLHAASSCKNHGGCAYCEGNRTHKFKRQSPIQQDREEY